MGILARLFASLLVGLALAVQPVERTIGWVPTATALIVGGIGFPTVDQATMAAGLGGYYSNNTLVNVPWPGESAPFVGTLPLGESVAVGLKNLDAAIRNTPGPKIAGGASGSTLVIDEEMQRLANDPTAPPPAELSFVVVGDANRGILAPLRGITVPVIDYTVPQIPDTPYNVTVVKGEYDGFADWPDRWWNLLAVFNALAGTGFWPGFGSVHWSSIWADPTQVPAQNITTSVNSKGGVTTTYLIPTADLPMLRPLKDMGVPQATIDTLNRVLRPIVDSAYVRNDPPSTGKSPRPSKAPTAAAAATKAHDRQHARAARAEFPAKPVESARRPMRGQPTSQPRLSSRA